MADPSKRASLPGHSWVHRGVLVLGVFCISQVVYQHSFDMRSSTKSGLVVASAALASSVTAAVDLKWYAPNATQINNLTSVLSGSGVYDFVYNNSYPTDVPYGTYDWCNMPHVRKEEYAVPSKEYKLKFVELVSEMWNS
jgi:hypothetical protein